MVTLEIILWYGKHTKIIQYICYPNKENYGNGFISSTRLLQLR